MVVDEVKVHVAKLLAGLRLYNRQAGCQLVASLVVEREVAQGGAHTARQRLRHLPQCAGQPAHAHQLADLDAECGQRLHSQGRGH